MHSSSSATENITVYYFPGNAKFPFGHIAIGDFPRHATYAPAGYLSYGTGEGLVRDLVKVTEGGTLFEYPLTAALENETYTGFKKIALPSCSREKLFVAMKNFGLRDRSDYNILTNNCANAVLNFLRDIEFINNDATFISPVRPQAIALQCCDILLESIKRQREEILAATSTPALSQIEDLINNDIERLKSQMMRDEIAHLSWYKNADKKIDKIHVLTSLSNKLAQAKLSRDPKELKECYVALVGAIENIGSTKTKSNLEKCISLFPKEYVVSIPLTFLKDYTYYKKHHYDILQDDLAPIEKIKSLIENDIYRLNAQISQQIKSVWTSQTTSEQKKGVKKDALTELLVKLADPINYTDLLQALEKASREKTMAGETSKNLNDCIEIFPYEKLPALPEMFNYLIKFDACLADDARGQNATLSEYRNLVPVGEEAICSLEPREVYQAFMKIAEKLSHLSSKTASKQQTLLIHFNEMANTIIGTNDVARSNEYKH